MFDRIGLFRQYSRVECRYEKRGFSPQFTSWKTIHTLISLITDLLQLEIFNLLK